MCFRIPKSARNLHGRQPLTAGKIAPSPVHRAHIAMQHYCKVLTGYRVAPDLSNSFHMTRAVSIKRFRSALNTHASTASPIAFLRRGLRPLETLWTFPSSSLNLISKPQSGCDQRTRPSSAAALQPFASAVFAARAAFGASGSGTSPLTTCSRK